MKDAPSSNAEATPRAAPRRLRRPDGGSRGGAAGGPVSRSIGDSESRNVSSVSRRTAGTLPGWVAAFPERLAVTPFRPGSSGDRIVTMSQKTASRVAWTVGIAAILLTILQLVF